MSKIFSLLCLFSTSAFAMQNTPFIDVCTLTNPTCIQPQNLQEGLNQGYRIYIEQNDSRQGGCSYNLDIEGTFGSVKSLYNLAIAGKTQVNKIQELQYRYSDWYCKELKNINYDRCIESNPVTKIIFSNGDASCADVIYSFAR